MRNTKKVEEIWDVKFLLDDMAVQYIFIIDSFSFRVAPNYSRTVALGVWARIWSINW